MVIFFTRSPTSNWIPFLAWIYLFPNTGVEPRHCLSSLETDRFKPGRRFREVGETDRNCLHACLHICLLDQDNGGHLFGHAATSCLHPSLILASISSGASTYGASLNNLQESTGFWTVGLQNVCSCPPFQYCRHG